MEMACFFVKVPLRKKQQSSSCRQFGEADDSIPTHFCNRSCRFLQVPLAVGFTEGMQKVSVGTANFCGPAIWLTRLRAPEKQHSWPFKQSLEAPTKGMFLAVKQIYRKIQHKRKQNAWSAFNWLNADRSPIKFFACCLICYRAAIRTHLP